MVFFIENYGIIYLGGLGMKLYIIRFNDCAYLETIEYNSHKERCEKTKGILPERVYEENELEKAMLKVYELNR